MERMSPKSIVPASAEPSVCDFRPADGTKDVCHVPGIAWIHPVYGINGDTVWWVGRVGALAVAKRDIHHFFLGFLSFFSLSCCSHYLDNKVHR